MGSQILAVLSSLPVLLVGLFAFGGRRESWQWLLLATGLAECLLLIVWMPVNYHGGGGTLGNRYFMNIYPLYFFLPPWTLKPLRSALVSWAVAGLFIMPILVDPFAASRLPGEHATSGAFKWLPVELSLVNNLPTNSDPAKFRQPRFGTCLHGICGSFRLFLCEHVLSQREAQRRRSRAVLARSARTVAWNALLELTLHSRGLERCEVAVAVIPDVIGGSEADNWAEAARAVHELAAYPERLMFIWHMNDSLDGLERA